MGNIFTFEDATELLLEEFHKLSNSNEFNDGPWKEQVDGVYKDMVYISNRRVFGTLKNGKNVWAWLNKNKEKNNTEEIKNTDVNVTISSIHEEMKNIVSSIHSINENINNIKIICEILYQHTNILDEIDKQEIRHILKQINSEEKSNKYPSSSIRFKKYMTDQDNYGYAILIGYGSDIKYWNEDKSTWVNKVYITSCMNEKEAEDLALKIKEKNTNIIKSVYSIDDIELKYVDSDKYKIICFDSVYDNDCFWKENYGWTNDYSQSSVFTEETGNVLISYLKNNAILPKNGI